ncbi:MAG: circadian clock KaiB family protein [Vicinamibacterales bacterium]
MATTLKGPPRAPRAARLQTTVWKVRLYVAGQTPRVSRAIANLTELCEEHLKGRYRIEIVDLLEHPELARGAQIAAVPTLVIKLPKVVRTIIGELSSADRALIGMALQPEVE